MGLKGYHEQLNSIPLLVSHEPFIGKFLNIVPGNNIEEWPDIDMAHD